MKTKNKPFEWLNAHDRKIFDLCGDIIRQSDPDFLALPGATELRRHATQLFKDFQEMDYDYDDIYYRIDQKFPELRKRFEQLLSTLESANIELVFHDIALDLEKEPEEVMEEIAPLLEPKQKIRITKLWPSTIEGSKICDSIQIHIEMSSDESGLRGRVAN